MSEPQFKNEYVCPECFSDDGWKTIDANKLTHTEARDFLECQHCHTWIPLVNVLEYNKSNSGWFRLD